MTTTPLGPATETPRRGLQLAAVAAAVNVVLVILLNLAAGPAVVRLIEVIVGLGVLVGSMVMYRRDWRYTAVGVLGGWIAGLIISALLSWIF